MLNTFLAISILAIAATSAEPGNAPAPTGLVEAGAAAERVTRSFDRAIVVAQASKRPAPPRRLDATAIIKSLAPIEYLPEHSGKKRTVDLDIRFEINSAKLSRSAIGQLDELAAAISAPSLKATRFRIAGHTDASGPAGSTRLCRRAARRR